MNYLEKVKKVEKHFEDRDMEILLGVTMSGGIQEEIYFISIESIDNVDLLFLHSLCADIFLSFKIKGFGLNRIRIAFENIERGRTLTKSET